MNKNHHFSCKKCWLELQKNWIPAGWGKLSEGRTLRKWEARLPYSFIAPRFFILRIFSAQKADQSFFWISLGFIRHRFLKGSRRSRLVWAGRLWELGGFSVLPGELWRLHIFPWREPLKPSVTSEKFFHFWVRIPPTLLAASCLTGIRFSKTFQNFRKNPKRFKVKYDF